MSFELLGDAATTAILNSELKWEIVAWIGASIASILWAIKLFVSLWDRFKYGLSVNSGNYVTHTEFKPLARRVDILENDVRGLTITLNKALLDVVRELVEIKGILRGKGIIQ